MEVVGPPCAFTISVRSTQFPPRSLSLNLVVGPPAAVRVNGKPRDSQKLAGEAITLTLTDAHGNFVRCKAALAVRCTQGSSLLLYGVACTELTIPNSGAYHVSDYQFLAPSQGRFPVNFSVVSIAGKHAGNMVVIAPAILEMLPTNPPTQSVQRPAKSMGDLATSPGAIAASRPRSTPSPVPASRPPAPVEAAPAAAAPAAPSTPTRRLFLIELFCNWLSTRHFVRLMSRSHSRHSAGNNVKHASSTTA